MQSLNSTSILQCSCLCVCGGGGARGFLDNVLLLGSVFTLFRTHHIVSLEMGNMQQHGSYRSLRESIAMCRSM